MRKGETEKGIKREQRAREGASSKEKMQDSRNRFLRSREVKKIGKEESVKC